MTNKIIIDGWNLAWKIPEIARLIPDNLSQARSELNRRIHSFYQQKNVTLKIIYDGKPGIISNESTHKNIDIRYAKRPEDADHMIIAFLKRSAKVNEWTVVTSDKELMDRIKNTGAGVISSEEFVRRIKINRGNTCEYSKKNDPNLSQKDIDYWLHVFKE